MSQNSKEARRAFAGPWPKQSSWWCIIGRKLLFTDALGRPWALNVSLIILETNKFSWTSTPGGRNESGETQTAGQHLSPPIPQAYIPLCTSVGQKFHIFKCCFLVILLEDLQVACQLPAGLPLRSCCTTCWCNA